MFCKSVSIDSGSYLSGVWEWILASQILNKIHRHIDAIQGEVPEVLKDRAPRYGTETGRDRPRRF
jgi:hypothetical protein